MKGERGEEYLALYQDGWTLTAIAVEYGVTRQAVHNTMWATLARLASPSEMPRERSSGPEIRARRKTEGLCPNCGNALVSGRLTCSDCRSVRAAYGRMLRAHREAANLCFCGRPRPEGYKTCGRHYTRKEQ